MSIADFFTPFGGTLNNDNRWIKLAELMPLDLVEGLYAESFKKPEVKKQPHVSGC